MECSICYAAYNVDSALPKVLKCGHSYCLQCIDALNVNERQSFFSSQKLIQCPYCRSTCSPHEINTNFALLELLQQKQDAEPSAPPLPENRKCFTHKLEVDAFCDTCTRFICRLCYQTSTCDHSSHIRMSMEEAGARTQQWTQRKLEEVKSNEEANKLYMQDLIESRNNLERAIMEIEQNAIDYFNNLRHEINVQHENFNCQIRQYLKKACADFHEREMTMIMRRQKFEEIEKKLRVAAEKGATFEATEALAACDLQGQDYDGLIASNKPITYEFIDKIKFCTMLNGLPTLFELRREIEEVPLDLRSWSLND